MKLKPTLPSTGLGKISVLLIVFTFGAWLFVTNAQHCLSRDFVEQAPPAICWRATNDYESTISQSQVMYLILLVLAIICSSASISRLSMKHSHLTRVELKRTSWFLAALSVLLLLFVVTIFEVWQRTTYNNNNYFLNTTSNAVVTIGAPFWLALTTAAITYGLTYCKHKK